MRKIVLLPCLFMLWIAAAMQAQNPGATVSGLVKDSQGSLIQGARVSVTSATQGATRESFTNFGGSYEIPDLLPGEYRVEVSAKGEGLCNGRVCACGG
ncbi:MAG: carboxypeptidase-like regulatory domain-containing protein [Terracidiphilus sp.]|jgi:hypothetical protein